MHTEGKLGFLVHCVVAFSVPLIVQLSLMNYDPIGSNHHSVADDISSTSADLGHEDSLVFVRHILLSLSLCIVYYIHLRTQKSTFIRACLHEENEKSINQVLDQVSEPVIIIKQKHKISMKPKYMNEAAKQMLQYNKFMEKKSELFE